MRCVTLNAHEMNTGIYSGLLLMTKVAHPNLLIPTSLEIESNLSFVPARFPLCH